MDSAENMSKAEVSLGEGVLLEDSSLPKEADRVAILLGEGVRLGDSSPSQQQEIAVDHGSHMSIDELLKVIKGANGMPLLFVPSNDGRLVAVAVEGLQNLQQAFFSWLLLMASLVATVTFTAALTPPGGFWDDDNQAKGYVAGTSVMRDKFPQRYRLFQFSNKMAFFGSLMIIGMLANTVKNKPKATALRRKICFPFVVAFCIVGLGTSFITGMSCDHKEDVFNGAMLVGVLVNISIPWVMSCRPRNP
ncbi:hypothetical protein VPH35_113690 [Triticum aestivum]